MDDALLNKKRWFAALDEWQKGYGRGAQAFLVNCSGKSKGYINRIFKIFKGEEKIENLKVSFEFQVAMANACGSDYLSFLQHGKTLIDNDKPKDIKNFDKTIKEHQDIVILFSNKEDALEINKGILKIDQRAPEKLDKIKIYVNGLIDGLPEETSEVDRKASGDDLGND